MSADSDRDDKKRQEEAEKSQAIEYIALRLDRLGYVSTDELWSRRRAGLKALPIASLQQLEQEVEQSKTSSEAMHLIVKAISDFEHAQRMA